MGEDLIVCVLEIGKDTEPDWKTARQRLHSVTVDDCKAAMEECGEPYSQDSGETEAAAMARFCEDAVDGLDQLEDMWKGVHRYGLVMYLRDSRVLIWGGGSWGDDPFDGYGNISKANALGVAAEAGFWNV